MYVMYVLCLGISCIQTKHDVPTAYDVLVGGADDSGAAPQPAPAPAAPPAGAWEGPAEGPTTGVQVRLEHNANPPEAPVRRAGAAGHAASQSSHARGALALCQGAAGCTCDAFLDARAGAADGWREAGRAVQPHADRRRPSPVRHSPLSWSCA
jgi:hypothetical protein